MIKKMLLKWDSNIGEALKKIDSNGKGCVFIVDDDEHLCGILTDGDIRRIILHNDCGLNEKIRPYLSSEFKYAYDTESVGELKNKIDDKVKIIPIVNKKKEVVDYFEMPNRFYVPVAHPQLQGNEFKYLIDAFLSTWISSKGEYIDRFEKDFSEYCQCQYGVTTSNGTVALHLALVALGIDSGDEVIVPDITFAATINAVLYTGAKPVIVDIEKDGWCISPEEIEKAITPKTKAIIPVHIYGQPCDMEKINAIAKKRGLYVIEDCAEAHGAEFDGKRVGSMGDIGCFSFFGNKVITTGEGGCCVTNNKELYDRMRLLRDHGMSVSRKYYHEMVGFNYRMTNLQAAIGCGQLEQIDKIHEMRNKLDVLYRTKLESLSFMEMQKINLNKRKKITWLFTVLVNDFEKREWCIKKLKEAGIDSRPFFIPLSEMDIYKEYVFSNKNSKEISKRGLNLPTAYDITEEIINKIVYILSEGERLV